LALLICLSRHVSARLLNAHRTGSFITSAYLSLLLPIFLQPDSANL